MKPKGEREQDVPVEREPGDEHKATMRPERKQREVFQVTAGNGNTHDIIFGWTRLDLYRQAPQAIEKRRWHFCSPDYHTPTNPPWARDVSEQDNLQLIHEVYIGKMVLIGTLHVRP